MKTTTAPDHTPTFDVVCPQVELRRCREADRLRGLAKLVDAAMAADSARIRLVHLVNPDPLEDSHAA